MAAQTLARLILGYIGIVEGSAAMIRFRERTRTFELAVNRAVSLGRRLVVIGDPDAGMHTRLMRAYGCGDVCIDLRGCPKCPATIVADITSGPIPGIEDDSAVVYLSCVLEYVPEPKAALAEIARIAGSPENVFLVTVQPWTFTALLYPGARWRGDVKDGHRVDMKPVALEEKVIATTIVGTLLGAAFWPRKRR